jgi:hypothetical protein
VAGLWARLGATAAVTLALGAGCWAVLQAAGVDPAIAESAAAGLAAVLVTLGTVWASRAGDGDPGQSAGAPMVARSPGALATRDVQGVVFGPGGNLADRLRIMGPDHPDTLTTRNMLAAAYQDTASPDQAISLVEENLVDRGDLLGDEECGEARPSAESFQQGAAAVPSLRGPEYPTDRRLGDPDDLVRLPDGSAVDTTERVVFRNGEYLDCRLENLEWWDERVHGPVPQPDATRGNDTLSLVSHRMSCEKNTCQESDACRLEPRHGLVLIRDVL